MKSIAYLTLILFFLSLKSYSQQDSTQKIKWGPYFSSYWKDTKSVTVSPLKWSGKQWLTAGAVVSVAAIISTQDVEIHDFFKRNTSSASEFSSKFGLEPLGGIYSLGTLGIFFIYGSVSKDLKGKQVALLGTKAYLVSGLFSQITKHIFHRQRPYQAETVPGKLNQYRIEGPFTSHLSFTSMPSGHTISAFAVATIISSAYSDYKIVPVLSYSIATLAAISRVHDNKHWASDVLIGGAVGWSIAKLIYNKNHWGIKIEPYGNTQSVGVGAVIPLK